MAAPCQYTISGTLYLPREGEFKINCIGFVNGSMKVRYIRDGRENYIDIDCTKIFEVRPKRFRLKKGILVKFSTPEGKSAEIRIRHVEGTTIDILIDAINNWRQIAIIRPLTQQLEEIKGAMAQFQARPTQEIEELKERLERLSRQINETTQQLPDLPADVRESLEQLREQVNQMGRVLTKREQTIEHIINAVSQLSNTMNAVLNQMQQILLQQQQLREEIVRRYERPVKLKGPVEISRDDFIRELRDKYWPSSKDFRFILLGGGVTAAQINGIHRAEYVWSILEEILPNVDRLASLVNQGDQDSPLIVLRTEAQPINFGYEIVVSTHPANDHYIHQAVLDYYDLRIELDRITRRAPIGSFMICSAGAHSSRVLRFIFEERAIETNRLVISQMLFPYLNEKLLHNPIIAIEKLVNAYYISKNILHGDSYIALIPYNMSFIGHAHEILKATLFTTFAIGLFKRLSEGTKIIHSNKKAFNEVFCPAMIGLVAYFAVANADQTRKKVISTLWGPENLIKELKNFLQNYMVEFDRIRWTIVIVTDLPIGENMPYWIEYNVHRNMKIPAENIRVLVLRLPNDVFEEHFVTVAVLLGHPDEYWRPFATFGLATYGRYIAGNAERSEWLERILEDDELIQAYEEITEYAGVFGRVEIDAYDLLKRVWQHVGTYANKIIEELSKRNGRYDICEYSNDRKNIVVRVSFKRKDDKKVQLRFDLVRGRIAEVELKIDRRKEIENLIREINPSALQDKPSLEEAIRRAIEGYNSKLCVILGYGLEFAYNKEEIIPCDTFKKILKETKKNPRTNQNEQNSG